LKRHVDALTHPSDRKDQLNGSNTAPHTAMTVETTHRVSCSRAPFVVATVAAAFFLLSPQLQARRVADDDASPHCAGTRVRA
jgi:hypothetical protein